MNFELYTSALCQFRFGKRLPGALYVFHDDAVPFHEPIGSLVAALKERHCVTNEFNVVKFRTDELKISFLSYPEFLSDPHPALRRAISIDLVTGKARHTDYGDNINPPILHRKETFIPQDHPQWPMFRNLTAAEVAAGLYEEVSTIGFRLNWERLLNEKGLALNGHSLETRSERPQIKHSAVPFIERHRTAITRYDLSKPVKTLLEYGLLKPSDSVFDYGCGQGADIRGLQALGYAAEGWDPVFRKDVPKCPANVVNLGYVLNVIEDPAERLEALVDAFRHTRRLLVVSSLIAERMETGRAVPFRDGVLTGRGTFQKYFEQQELQQYVEDALEVTAVPVALGIFYVFRNASEQQEFLSARSRRNIDWSQVTQRLGLGGPPKDRWRTTYEENKQLLDEFGSLSVSLGRFPQSNEFPALDDVFARFGNFKKALRTFVLGSGTPDLNWSQVARQFGIGQPRKTRAETLYEQHGELLESFWRTVLQLGRIPAPEEFDRHSDLLTALGSCKKALWVFSQRGGEEALRQSQDIRKNDVLVYVALANLRKRVPFGYLPFGLRLDVKEFFGSYKNALEKGLELLYAAGDVDEVELACEDLAIGWQDGQALYIHRSLLDRLPAVLRANVGCAAALFGAAEQADIIKLHKKSGKVTFLIYGAFDTADLPELHQRVKVNLRTRWIQVFDHSSEGQLLFYKERFLSLDHPGREAMEKVSSKMRKVGVTEDMGKALTKAMLSGLLAK